jgi:hypothetical protein
MGLVVMAEVKILQPQLRVFQIHLSKSLWYFDERIISYRNKESHSWTFIFLQANFRVTFRSPEINKSCFPYPKDALDQVLKELKGYLSKYNKCSTADP